jgi:metal-sulfur cluster biosynthetic enzyme
VNVSERENANVNEQVNKMSENTSGTQHGAEPQATPAAAETDIALMDLESKAREALREVYDPELGMSVMELGLIRKFDWTPGNVDVTMILTTPFCPYGPALIEQVRQKVQETTQLVTRVTMGLEMWDPSMMEDQAAANWGLYY